MFSINVLDIPQLEAGYLGYKDILIKQYKYFENLI